ncbi:hypothetical protein BC832DRAFT_160588 [Gaertneriomyces semiglobifer]|nr:hypothetical protein BC832DRAFT_160588 [Gaertneriomyces semiglobifer]
MQVDSDLRATTVTEATAVSLSKPLPPATKPEDEDTLIICSARPSQQALRPPSNQMPSAAEKKGVNSFATSTQSVNETREPSQYVPPNNHPVEQSKRNTSICSQGNGISANALEEKFHAMGLNDPLVPTVDTPSRSNQHDLPRPQHAAKDQDAPAVADGRTTLSTTASIGSTMPPAEWDREPQSATTPVALDQTIHPGTQAPQVPHAIPWEPPALAVPWFGSSGSHKVDMYGYPNQFLHADPYAPVPQWNGQGLTTLSGDQNDVERGASTGLNATHAMHASHPVGAATHQSTAEDPSAVKRGVAELCLKIRSTDDVVHTFILSVDDPDPFQTLRVFCHTRGLNAYVGALWKEVQSRLI